MHVSKESSSRSFTIPYLVYLSRVFMTMGKTHPQVLVPQNAMAMARPSLLLNQCVTTMLPMLKNTALAIYRMAKTGRQVRKRATERTNTKLGTHAYAETLAEDELPIFRAFGREHHASDEKDRCGEYGEPEVSPVEQSADDQPRSITHCPLKHDYQLIQRGPAIAEGDGPAQSRSTLCATANQRRPLRTLCAALTYRRTTWSATGSLRSMLAMSEENESAMLSD